MAKKEEKEKKVIETVIIPYFRDVLGYDIELMKREVPVRFGHAIGTKYADLVFYIIRNNIKRPFLVVEAKAPGEKLDIGQGESYAQRLKAPFFVITDGKRWIWYKTEEGQGNSKPLENPPIPPKAIGKGKLLKFRDIRECMRIMKRCHDVIWNEKSSTPEEAFRELTNILIAKVEDEKSVNELKRTEYLFRILKTNETAIEIKDRINGLLEDARQRDKDLFTEDDFKIGLKASSVAKIVEILQDYLILNEESLDSLGITYEAFLKDTYTDKIKGQRFTPREIVNFMARFIDPKLSDYIIDPACGTGGFLLSSLNHIKDKLYQAFEEGDELNPDKRLREYATTHLFGIDIDKTVAKIAKVNMLMHGDGHTNIFRHDGLIDTKRTKKIVDFVNKNGGFDIVLTNPPFGGGKNRS